MEISLQQLKHKRADILSDLAQIKRDIQAEEEVIVLKEYKVKIGSVVEYEGKEYQVTNINTFSWEGTPPWLKGYMRKKDGNFGIAERNLFSDWTVIST